MVSSAFGASNTGRGAPVIVWPSAFDLGPSGKTSLCVSEPWQPADGSGGPEPLRLSSDEYLMAPNSFSPDGQLMAFIELHPTTGRDIWVMNVSDRDVSIRKKLTMIMVADQYVCLAAEKEPACARLLGSQQQERNRWSKDLPFHQPVA